MATDDEPRASSQPEEGVGSAYAPPRRRPKLTNNPTMLAAFVVVVLAVVAFAVLLAVA